MKVGFAQDGRTTALDMFVICNNGSYDAVNDANTSGNIVSLLYQPLAIALARHHELEHDCKIPFAARLALRERCLVAIAFADPAGIVTASADNPQPEWQHSGYGYEILPGGSPRFPQQH